MLKGRSRSHRTLDKPGFQSWARRSFQPIPARQPLQIWMLAPELFLFRKTGNSVEGGTVPQIFRLLQPRIAPEGDHYSQMLSLLHPVLVLK